MLVINRIMKLLIGSSLLLVAVSATFDSVTFRNLFEEFKIKHNKSYASQEEESKRYMIFVSTVEEVATHNHRHDLGLESYTKGINQFTDWTKEEFQAYLTFRPSLDVNHTDATWFLKQGIKVPDSVDWRKKDYVTPVKDQGHCGSCWTFSLTGAVEGAYKKKSGKLVSLSEQQLVECSVSEYDAGCKGGSLIESYPYIKQNGLESESDYPYTSSTGTNGTCKYNSSKVVSKIDSYVLIERGDEDALLEAVATVGPISVAIDGSVVQEYIKGIIKDNSKCSKDNLNHAVLVVGYGTENGVDYWIVKNSWGVTSGEDGYFRLRRGINICGVAEMASYPIIN